MPHAARGEFRRLPAHVTLRVLAGVPSLRTVAIVRAIERSFARACTRPGCRLVPYSLQGNHAHLIVEADDRAALGRGMTAIGTRLALAGNRVAKRSGRVLADRYHVRLLPTPREVRNALRYVLLNARRHASSGARTAARVLLDPASSAWWFDGWRGTCAPPRGRTSVRRRQPERGFSPSGGVATGSSTPPTFRGDRPHRGTDAILATALWSRRRAIA